MYRHSTIATHILLCVYIICANKTCTNAQLHIAIIIITHTYALTIVVCNNDYSLVGLLGGSLGELDEKLLNWFCEVVVED